MGTRGVLVFVTISGTEYEINKQEEQDSFEAAFPSSTVIKANGRTFKSCNIECYYFKPEEEDTKTVHLGSRGGILGRPRKYTGRF